MKLNKILLLLAVISTISIITACTSKLYAPPQGMAVDQMIQDMRTGVVIDKKLKKEYCYVPSAVNNALLPSFSAKERERFFEKRFDISANKISAKDFYMGLVEGTPYNIVVDPSINGEISLKLKNVTIQETLQAVRDSYAYDFRRTSYGYEIYPIKLVTQIYTINYLDVKRKGKSLIQVSSGQISEQVAGTSTGSGGALPAPIAGTQTTPSGSSVNTDTDANFWRDLENSLKQIIANLPGRSVVVNRQSGIITVTALPREIRQISRFLAKIQCSMERQVILEAKILEVQLNDQFQAGIDWHLFGDVIGAEDGGISQNSLFTFPNSNDLVDFNGIFTLRINGDFGALIKLLQTQGNVQVLSSPRISTVNNQKAIIKVGDDQFFVTGVTSTNVVTGVSNNSFPSENINLTPFFSGITLDVTPQISSAGDVILHIHPTVSEVRDQEKTIVLGNNGAGSSPNTFILPLAKSTIRESDNIVRAKSGQVIVIGGLLKNDQREEIAGVPIVSRIPVIGPFFRHTFQLSRKIELVILLRPVLATNDTQILEMEGMNDSMQNMRRGFHDGGLIDVFGNEGEKPIPYP